LIERLRTEAIGEPEWMVEKCVYEYREHSAKVVAILKLIRAAHGITTLELLCRSGLFIDLGVVLRCEYETIMEVYFLLEEFPNSSTSVDQFVKSFFEATIDGYLSRETHSVQTRKIRAGMVRVLKGRQDEETQAIIDRIYQTFSGYVHANYAHIMEVYNGNTAFNLTGVPSVRQREMRAELVEQAAISLVNAVAFVAQTLGLIELQRDIATLGTNVAPPDTR
jgi:hypothetical protein